MNISTKRLLCLWSIIIASVSSLYPCALTVINNSPYKKIVLVDKDASISMIVNQGATSEVFGDPNKRAHFTIMVPMDALAHDPQSFRAEVVVRQKACTMSHQIVIHAADILNKKVEDADILEVTDYQQKYKANRMYDPVLMQLPVLTSTKKTESMILAQREDHCDLEPRTTGFCETNAQTRETSGNIPIGEKLDDENGLDVVPFNGRRCGPHDPCYR